MTSAKPLRRTLVIFLRIILVIVLIPVINFGLYFMLRGATPTKTQLIAHRGGLTHNPENTLVAFQHAINTDSDWLEFDVQRSKDGELVVFHDVSVDRTTNGTGKITELNLEELRALDAGNGQQIPTLQEVINLAKDNNVNILPELKSAQLYPNIDEQIIEALIDASYADKTIIQSFNHNILETLKNNHPDIRVCPLYSLWKLNLSTPQPHNAEVLCPMAEMVLLNPWMIKQAHDQEKEIYVWFGLSEHQFWMKNLQVLGVDGIMVDDTVVLKKVLEP